MHIEASYFAWAQRLYITCDSDNNGQESPSSSLSSSQISYNSWEVIPLLEADEQQKSSPKSALTKSNQQKHLNTELVVHPKERQHVCFEQPIVTCVRYVPKVTNEERVTLFYTKKDTRRFLKLYRNRRVRFCKSPVSEIRIVPKLDSGDVARMFYSKEEIKSFLEDFVQSLNEYELAKTNVWCYWNYRFKQVFIENTSIDLSRDAMKDRIRSLYWWAVHRMELRGALGVALNGLGFRQVLLLKV
mmetsp:Transcript_16406/g.20472  ORF Transcript_16406/g.20472 Transcript_16406/m.20472 type:complete len:244 (-) Transcript_16406:289-1020(-)